MLFNGSKDAATYRNDAWRDARFELHPVQATGKDPVVRASRFDPKDGAFSVPGRTTAVFVERR